MYSRSAALAILPVVFAAILPRQSQPSANACAEISSAWAASGVQPGDTYTVRDGQLAQDCLSDIPFYPDIADGLLTELQRYIQFQSTLEVLKSPPEAYRSDPVDILGGLSSIQDKVDAKVYKGQYEFETDINNLLRSANDGHLSVGFCTHSFFVFGRPSTNQIALVSTDGTSTPELYMLDDAGFAGSHHISTIDTINGQVAIEYLNTIAANKSNQDPDARMNTLFPSYAAGASGSTGRSYGAFLNNNGLWPGSSVTTLVFRNGSRFDIPTRANIALDSFANVTDGQSLFEQYCLPDPTATSIPSTSDPLESGVPPQTEPQQPSSSISLAPVPTAGPIGYPEPKIRDSYNQISGFDLDNSTAVMFIPSFVSSSDYGDNQSAIFSEVATSIVSEAVASGRTHLIIDLTSNPGGDIVRAFDLFKLFFPNELPYSATRHRRHDASNLLVKALATLNKTEATMQGNFGYRGQVTPNPQDDFASSTDFQGDEVQLNVKVSSLYANFNYTATSTPTTPIGGYGSTPLPDIDNQTLAQPFSPENILIITNGDCSSTCTTFTNLMTNVGNVRSVAFGGRPQPGPMQLMGGVRGAQSASFDLLAGFAADANATLQDNPNLLSETEREVAARTWPRWRDEWPVKVTGGNVNLRNAYQESQQQLPLQFSYQAADCRLFYTYHNYVDPASVWKSAWRAVWGEGSERKCVAGSEGAEGSRGNREVLSSNATGTKGTEDEEDGQDNAAVLVARSHGLVSIMTVSAVAVALLL